MPVERKAYRISRFGTIALPQEIRRAVWCVMKLQVQAQRGPAYYSRERIPFQTVHGWITVRDSDGFVVEREWDWRFDKQRWLLWELTDYQVTVNQCFIANKQTEVLLVELAKKPNIPPIPPSLPPVGYDSFFGKVPQIIHGYESITIKTRLELDFDVEFVYGTRTINGCSPNPEELPRGPAPLEDELPKPGGENGIAPGPVFPAPIVPVDSPPIGGTAKIPEGYQGGDQSSAPNTGPPSGTTLTTFFFEWTRSDPDGAGNCVASKQTFLVGTAPGGWLPNQLSFTQVLDPEPVPLACDMNTYTAIIDASSIPGFSGIPALQRGAIAPMELKAMYS
jgi:hypothetical protein